MSLVFLPGTAAAAEAVHRAEASAFPTDAEARPVDGLRAHGALVLSMVADDGGRGVRSPSRR